MSASAVLTRPTDQDTDDRDLVAGVCAGDDRAFELLFQRYQPRIAAYVRSMVRDHGRAEDITQEVFISALRRMREESDREILFKPWIYEIAKNKCIDAFRRGRAANEVSFDAQDAIGADEHGRLAEPGATPDSAVEGKVAIDNLCGAFGGLSSVHHDILVLREFEGLSYREIGERLGMSRPAVESTLFRARKRLSEEYEQLVSGERCLSVRRTVDASDGGAARLRDQRRMARHIAHCQPCRRYARLAGVDIGEAARPAAAVAARMAALLPLPGFLRRRWGGDEAAALLGRHGGGSLSHLSANLASVVDPAVASNWAKAIATAATVAVAGVGAGAALTDRQPSQRSVPAATPLMQSPRIGIFAAPRSHAVTPAGPGAAGQAPAGRRRSGGAHRPTPSADRTPVRSPDAPAGAPQAPGAKPPARDLNIPPRPLPGGVQHGEARNPVKSVLDGVGAVRHDRVDRGSGATAPVAPRLTGALTAPVAPAAAAAGEGLSAAGGAGAGEQAGATATGDTVSSTVTEALATTTSALDGLVGG